jgi:hypothetical protein
LRGQHTVRTADGSHGTRCFAVRLQNVADILFLAAIVVHDCALSLADGAARDRQYLRCGSSDARDLAVHPPWIYYPGSYATRHRSGLMQGIFLCGLSSLRAPRCRYCEPRSRRIKEEVINEAINLSVARKRPDFSFGGVTASSASRFMDGSARV